MRTVLIVEDNALNRELLRELLEIEGYRVLEASHGPQALATVNSMTPDLFLVDLQMPGMDGFALLRALRADPRCQRIPIAAVSAFAVQGDRERALASGFDAYLTKPIDFPSLRRVLEQLLASGGGSPKQASA